MHYYKNIVCNAIKLGTKVLGYCFLGKTVTKEDIAQSYNKVSTGYYTTYLRKMHYYNDEIHKWIIKYDKKQSQKILDLAGGTGYNCTCLAQKLKDADFTLIDISEKMLKECQDTEIEKIKSGMCDYMRTVKDNTFDSIICTWALKYEKPNQVLKECYRILKPNGRLYILVNSKKTLPQIRACYIKLLVLHVQKVRKLMFDLPMPKNKKQLRKWGRKQGFRCIKAKEYRQDFKFFTFGEAIRFVTSTGALAGYDVMIDIRHPEVLKEMELFLKKQGSARITHHFISAIFQKPEVTYEQKTDYKVVSKS